MKASDENLSDVHKLLEGWLRDGDWKPVSSEENVYLINHRGEGGITPIYCKFSPDEYFLNFSGKYSYPIPEEKIPSVLEYINHLSYGIPIGSLEIKDSTNEVYFCTSLLLYKIKLTEQLIDTFFVIASN